MRDAEAGTRPLAVDAPIGRRVDPRRTVAELATAAHLGPTLAVTVVVALLAVAADQSPGTAVLVTAAVFCGQLTIGWGNDLRDAARDRRVGREEKPLASGRLSPRLVQRCLAVAMVGAVLLSFLVGWRSAVVHLGLGVASGHAYNLGLKGTAWSWLPYAVAFGSLPGVVSLAGADPQAPTWWMVAAAAALGVAAHFLNTLPDLADDAATGVRGLPHRIGERASRLTAVLLLVAASLAVVIPAGGVAAWAAVAVVLALAPVVVRGSGKAPFVAAVVIALLDVALLAVLAP